MFNPINMPRGQYRVLLAIASNPDSPSTVEHVVAMTGYTPQSAAAYACALKRKGLVRNGRYEDDEVDQQSFALTDAGVELFCEVIDTTAALERLSRRQRASARAVARHQQRPNT